MRTIKELLDVVISIEGELRDAQCKPQLGVSIDFSKGVPTLENGVYRKPSPMLKERFEAFGKCINATHGDWLDTDEMEVFWKEHIADGRLAGISESVKASMENWQDHAASLFARNRVSVFAASDNSYEMICLVWFDSTDEPELWVYDCNGVSRYKDLASYLQAYIDDDMSACSQKWILAEM